MYTYASSCLCRTSRHTPGPSNSGIIQSISASLGPPDLQSSRAACRPLSTVITSYPLCCSIRPIRCSETGSSSATRILTGRPPGTGLPASSEHEAVPPRVDPRCRSQALDHRSVPLTRVRMQASIQSAQRDFPMHPSANVPRVAVLPHRPASQPPAPIESDPDSFPAARPATPRVTHDRHRSAQRVLLCKPKLPTARCAEPASTHQSSMGKRPRASALHTYPRPHPTPEGELVWQDSHPCQPPHNAHDHPSSLRPSLQPPLVGLRNLPLFRSCGSFW